MVAHDAAVLSAEQLAELLEALVQNARGGAHSEILRTLDLGEYCGRGEVVHRVGEVGVQMRVDGLELLDEALRFFLGRDVDRLGQVRAEESVDVDHRRDENALVLAYAVGDHREVKSLLRALCEYLDPALIALGHNVGVVAPESHGAGDGAADDRHDSGQSGRGAGAGQLMHKRKAVGRARGEGTDARGRRTNDGAYRRVLGLGGDVCSGILLLVYQGCDSLNDRSLRSDRVRCDKLNLGAHDAMGNSGIAVKSLDNTHNYLPSFTQSASSTKSMAFLGHSAVQMPQPLQYV